MDTKRLKFDDMIEQVKSREYQTKIPAWIHKLTRTKKPTPNQDEEYNNGGGRSGGDGGKCRFK